MWEHSGPGTKKWLLSCGALAFNEPRDSDLEWWVRGLLCGPTGSWIHAGWKAPMTADRNSSSIASYQKKRKERGKLVTVSLTLRSPKGGTATSMWMERTRLGPTGWGECSESALCRHWDSLNPTPLSFSTRIPQQLSHLLSSCPSISCSFISKDIRKREIKI